MQRLPTRQLGRLLVWLATVVVLLLPAGVRGEAQLQPYEEEEELLVQSGSELSVGLPHRASPDPAPAAYRETNRPSWVERALDDSTAPPGASPRCARTYLLCARLLI